MAFTKTPAQDVYQTKQVPLMYDWENRDVTNTKAAISTNVLYELVKNSDTGDGYYRVLKRDGSVDLIDTAADGGNVLGMFYWGTSNPTTSTLVVVTQNKIKFYDSNFAVTINTAYAGWIADVAIVRYKYENGTEVLILSDGFTVGILSTAGVFTPITDPDFPTQTARTPVVLDGYLFVADKFGHIRNSALNDPLTWAAADSIDAEAYADKIEAIARVGTYIVSLGAQHTEWFYDAANPTGTPLAVVAGATQRIGYIHSLASDLNSLFFVGVGSNGSPSVFKLSDLKIQDIGNATIRRWLNNVTTSSDVFGSLITLNGHKCYVITDNRNATAPQTYYCDLETMEWHKLLLGSSTNGAEFRAYCQIFSFDPSPTNRSITLFSTADRPSVVRAFKPLLYRDSLVNFTASFVTRPIDFGNKRIKFMGRLVFDTDQTSSASSMSVSWSDDDYQTFSTPRTVALQNVYEPLYACGSFRKRAFQVTYTDNFPMRWNTLEADYVQGQA